MHYQAAPYREAKLVRCVAGAIYDVIVDLRASSPTRFQWVGIDLSADNCRALFIPEGFAHGFVTLTDGADLFYQMGNFYQPEASRGLRYNDPLVGIAWPREAAFISERDAQYPDVDPAGFDA